MAMRALRAWCAPPRRRGCRPAHRGEQAVGVIGAAGTGLGHDLVGQGAYFGFGFEGVGVGGVQRPVNAKAASEASSERRMSEGMEVSL
jgi:hypothetical protein